MEDVAPVLKCGMTIMSSKSDVSISSIYPITYGLLHSHLKRNEEDSARVLEFKVKVHASLVQRMQERDVLRNIHSIQNNFIGDAPPNRLNSLL